jgi:hypothetical protein
VHTSEVILDFRWQFFREYFKESSNSNFLFTELFGESNFLSRLLSFIWFDVEGGTGKELELVGPRGPNLFGMVCALRVSGVVSSLMASASGSEPGIIVGGL